MFPSIGVSVNTPELWMEHEVLCLSCSAIRDVHNWDDLMPLCLPLDRRLRVADPHQWTCYLCPLEDTTCAWIVFVVRCYIRGNLDQVLSGKQIHLPFDASMVEKLFFRAATAGNGVDAWMGIIDGSGNMPAGP